MNAAAITTSALMLVSMITDTTFCLIGKSWKVMPARS